MKEFLQVWLDIFYAAFENRLYNGIEQESTDPKLIHQHRAEKSEAYKAYQQIRQLKDEKPKVTMDYEEKRAKTIRIGEIIREWTDRHELQTSPGMEIELAEQLFLLFEIFNKLINKKGK